MSLCQPHAVSLPPPPGGRRELPALHINFLSSSAFRSLFSSQPVALIPRVFTERRHPPLRIFRKLKSIFHRSTLVSLQLIPHPHDGCGMKRGINQGFLSAQIFSSVRPDFTAPHCSKTYELFQREWAWTASLYIYTVPCSDAIGLTATHFIIHLVVTAQYLHKVINTIICLDAEKVLHVS